MSARTIRSIIEDRQPVTAPATTLVSDAARIMKQAHVGGILVVDGDKLVGIFSERDALYRVVAEGHDPKTTPLVSVMTRNPKTIGPDKPFASALSIMHEGRFRHVPVVDHGRPVGMVSAADAMGPELEQFIFSLLADDQARDILA